MSSRRVLRHPLVRRIVPDLQAERGRSGELEAMLAPFTAARWATGITLIVRAVSCGELRADAVGYDFNRPDDTPS